MAAAALLLADYVPIVVVTRTPNPLICNEIPEALGKQGKEVLIMHQLRCNKLRR
jgi:hypothetical protein